jgi:putative membrane-bound dehydrogenase-like protein
VVLAATMSCRKTGPPFSPEESLSKLKVADGFRVELAAAEPQVLDPIAAAFDERGRMYVVEMSDYPNSNQPKGQIRMLEDRDGDGRYEHMTVFAKGLHFPHGVLPWKSGVIVTSAPDILYLKDTDGDGRADVRQVLMTGFAQVNPQLRVNTPLYGIDNWIYAAYPKFGGGVRFKQFSDFGHPITWAGHPEIPPVDIFSKGMDLRFKPDELRLEPVSGNSEYGLTFDARGHRFVSWNDRHVQEAVLENRYAIRNPYLAIGTAVQGISDHGDSAQVFPITEGSYLREIRDPQEFSQLGHFTSACGQSVYTGGLFKAPYNGAYYICEPVHNLVHVDRLIPHGASLIASRVKDKSEFLASKDPWFMPVFTTVGPDGAIYVVDFYRKVVEHPEWVRKDLVNDNKLFEAGEDKGRIYRIVAEGSHGYAPPRLDRANVSELVRTLAHENMWWRLTAQRLLVERQNKAAIPELERLAGGSSPEGRMHALWTLDGLHALRTEMVVAALSDPSAMVREQAVRIAESRGSDPGVAAKLSTMVADPDSEVEFQVACTLGQLPPEKSFGPLRQIVVRHMDDSWFQLAVLSAAADNGDRWLRSFAQDRNFVAASDPGKAMFLHRISGILGARQKTPELHVALMLLAHGSGGDWWKAASLQGLAEGLKRGAAGRVQLSGDVEQQLLTLASSPSMPISEAAFEVASAVRLSDSPQLRALIEKASTAILNPQSSSTERAQSARVLGLDVTQRSLPMLEKVFNPQQPEEVQMAVAKALLGMPDRKSTQLLLKNWSTYTAPVRDVVVAGFLQQSNRVSALLDAVQAGDIQPASLSRSTRQKIQRYHDSDIRKRAAALLANVTSDRSAVIEKFRAAATMHGDAQRGREVFRKNCSDCHRLGTIGVSLGPDLATVANRPKDDLLVNILDPNANIAPGYEEYMIQTTDGRLITGVIGDQSATSVTLRRRKGEEDTVLRGNIAEFRALTTSAMPDDLEDGFTVNQLADLLEFLKGQQNSTVAKAKSDATN